MEIKLNGKWLDVVLLTKHQKEAHDAVEKALATGNSVAVICVEAVDTDGNKPELISVDLD